MLGDQDEGHTPRPLPHSMLTVVPEGCWPLPGPWLWLSESYAAWAGARLARRGSCPWQGGASGPYSWCPVGQSHLSPRPSLLLRHLVLDRRPGPCRAPYTWGRV